MRASKGKHSRTIDTMVNRLVDSNTNYALIRTEEKFHNPNSGRDGECDIYAIYKTPKVKYLLVFEVKSSYSGKNDRKSEYQCTKDVNYYSKRYKTDRAFRFQVYGSRKDDGVSINWLRKPLIKI